MKIILIILGTLFFLIGAFFLLLKSVLNTIEDEENNVEKFG
jgi:uncharacterized protein YneF (UPF0154 family)